MTTTAHGKPEQQLAELREQREALIVSREIALLQSQLDRVNAQRELVEGWGDFVNPLDAFRGEHEYFGATGLAGPRASRPADRADGDNAPIFSSEAELAVIRGAGDWIAQSDTTAMGALEALASYVVGTDGQIDAAAKEDVEGAEQAESDAQGVIDDFLRRAKWLNDLDREHFRRWRTNGETFLEIVDSGGGWATLRTWEPAWITEPVNARQIEAHYGLPPLDWKYGVATSPGEPTEVWGYYGLRNGDPRRGEFVPAQAMIHIKTNVAANVKRGLSDFYPGQQWLEKAAKLLDRVLDGGAIQASIALVKKYAPHYKQAAMRSAADSLVDFDAPLPSAGRGGLPRTVPAERFYSGKIVDMQGVDVEAGPLGQSNAPVYLDIEQAGVTKALRRWQMHKALATGDASADTYASALVAEAPFTKVCESMQGQFAAAIQTMLWRVLDLACLAGRLPYEPQQLRTLIDVTARLPDVAVRDKAEDHQIRREQHEAGLLSLETWSEQVGLSREQEIERLASERAAAPDLVVPPGMARGLGQPQLAAARLAALAEAVRTARTLGEARLLIESCSDSTLLEHCGANAPGGGGFQPGNTCAKGGGGAVDRNKRYERGELESMSDGQLNDVAANSENDRTKRLASRIAKERAIKAAITPEQRAEQQRAIDAHRQAAEKAAAPLKAAIAKGEQKIAAANLSPADAMLAKDHLRQSQTPGEASRYAAAVASWGRSDPERAAIEQAVAELKRQGVPVKPRGQNYSHYGQLPDGRTVRVADHLGFDAHDVEIVFDGMPSRERAAAIIQSAIEEIRYAAA